MSVKIEKVERQFKYGALTLEDPDANLTPQEVKDFYADIYPELTQARVEGPEYTETSAVYEFKKTAGTKGAERPLTVRKLARQRTKEVEPDPKAVRKQIRRLELMGQVSKAIERTSGDYVLPPSEAQGMV